MKCLSILLVLLSLSAINAKAQITADSIANHIVMDSGHAREPYMEYATKLANLLAGYTPAQLHRIFGKYSTVIPPGPKLNDELSLDEIGFGNWSSKLTADAKEELDKVAEFLKHNPDAKIIIEGHTATDRKGTQRLSENRAEAAKIYLAKQGIDIERLESVGYGYANPAHDGYNNPDNRRIEIYVDASADDAK